ncbi:hypothetical protein [Bradyrhizobium sp. SZCCHNR3003]|uniref:hypothetical protein n=1 Tax=Bradyrhizobium TaxID=374 RepID=UPI0029169666|nr:hypothetical protein [Bradyrhizobium sp. SZCCHNR3003]
MLIDNRAGHVLSAGRTGGAVRSIGKQDDTSRPRMLRRIVAACLMLAYVLAGALHGACDIDVAHPFAGKPEIASLLDRAGHTDQRGVADHHCHGCFSVAVPQPQFAAVPAEVVAATGWAVPLLSAGILPESESPPPRHLS